MDICEGRLEQKSGLIYLCLWKMDSVVETNWGGSWLSTFPAAPQLGQGQPIQEKKAQTEAVPIGEFALSTQTGGVEASGARAMEEPRSSYYGPGPASPQFCSFYYSESRL